MKYKLLKDLPGHPAGSVFTEENVLYSDSIDGRHLDILEIYKDNQEWFEPVNERWRGERGEQYWSIKNGRVFNAFEIKSTIDNLRYESGHYFRLESQAEEANRRILYNIMGYHAELRGEKM